MCIKFKLVKYVISLPIELINLFILLTKYIPKSIYNRKE